MQRCGSRKNKKCDSTTSEKAGKNKNWMKLKGVMRFNRGIVNNHIDAVEEEHDIKAQMAQLRQKHAKNQLKHAGGKGKAYGGNR